MKFKRVLSLMLAVLAIASSVVSCSKEEKKETPVSVPTEENEPEFTVIDGEGETFDIFIGYKTFDSDFIVEEETGDILKDTIYQRNVATENKFNIDLQFRAGDDKNNTASDTIRSLIQSGDDTYELFINVQHVGIPLIYEGLFVDWNEDMPYVNLDNPWWYSRAIKDLNFSDKIFVAVGAYNFHCLRSAGCLVFNKNILDELELDYPYQLVRDGEWTVDKMIEYSKKAVKDLDGDGFIKEDNDRLGYSGWRPEMFPALFVGMGGKPVTKNDENLPKLNVNNERTYMIMDKMIELFDDGNGAWCNKREYGFEDTMFFESRLLFNDSTLSTLTGLRNMEDDFGVVPYPKLDTDQENYYSRVVNFASLSYVPVTNDKLELTSAVLEYMAYVSNRDIVPAFYDVILTVKSVRDVESEEMVDIIRESASFMDENYLKSNDIANIVESGQNTLSSNYAAYGDSWEIKLAELTEFWEG